MHDDGIVTIGYIPKYIATYSFVLYPMTVQNIWMIASKYHYTDWKVCVPEHILNALYRTPRNFQTPCHMPSWQPLIHSAHPEWQTAVWQENGRWANGCTKGPRMYARSSIVDQSSSHCYIRINCNARTLCTVNELYNTCIWSKHCIMSWPESKLKGHTYTYT